MLAFRAKWEGLYDCENIDQKAETLQTLLLNKYDSIFPIKEMNVSNDDQPWFSERLKKLDMKRGREYCKNKKSEKWKTLKDEYDETLKREKAKYY